MTKDTVAIEQVGTFSVPFFDLNMAGLLLSNTRILFYLLVLPQL